MPKLYSSVRIVKVLLRKGFVFISQKGSHAKFKYGRYTVIIPMGRKKVPLGTLKSILRQANLNESDLDKND
ncbi:MAG: hypothetical protein G01um101444_230 [Parcubacteria group bacterium Gr01-1014_44]|nr:MAG: hypothetical protein G01um101444_230 [Parcubacteria group bacterium Gr01-1014_44]